MTADLCHRMSRVLHLTRAQDRLQFLLSSTSSTRRFLTVTSLFNNSFLWVCRRVDIFGDGCKRPSFDFQVIRNISSSALLKKGLEQIPQQEWLSYFEKLRKFHDEQGHFYIVKDDRESNTHLQSLHTWMENQRRLYKRNKLTPTQVALLDNLSFPWTSRQARWNRNISGIKKFKEEHGHCLIPQNTKLGKSVNHLRLYYDQFSQGKPSPLTVDRVQELDELGFVWDVHEDFWQRRYEQLKQFRKEHGHVNISYILNSVLQLRDKNMSKDKLHEYRELFFWCMRQRILMRRFERNPQNAIADTKVDHNSPEVAKIRNIHMNGHVISGITPERIKLLNEIGFEWELTVRHSQVHVEFDDAWWDKKIAELKQHYASGIPREDFSLNLELGRWVQDVRFLYSIRNSVGAGEHITECRYDFATEALSCLTQERIDELNSMNFSWPPHHRLDVWEWRYRQISDFYRENGHSLYPMTDLRNKLVKWINLQRNFYRILKDDTSTIEDSYSYRLQHEALLLGDRLKKLIDINFVWNVGDYKWNQYIITMVEYKRNHPKLCWPYKKHKSVSKALNLLSKAQSGVLTEKEEIRLETLKEIGFDGTNIDPVSPSIHRNGTRWTNRKRYT